MGEGRNDHSSKRQKSSYDIGKSSSGAKVAHGKGKSKGRKNKTKERWPFLEGLTVDGLARYRRKRIQDRPKDNLQPLTESVIQNPTSEYQRAFNTNIEEFSKENVWSIKDRKPEDYLQVEEIIEDDTDFKEYKTIGVPFAEKESTSLVNDQKTMETETDTSHFITHGTLIKRPSLIRRGTSLKCDGNFYTDTETLSAYVAYEGQHRPQLTRRPTSLKMEGDLDVMTEKCEKFIEWLNVSRPELMRIPTHLKMEGELETTTENQEKYIPFVGARRPELLRRSTNLKLEGATYFIPEYTDVFKNYNVKDRLQLKKSQTHLRKGGNFFQITENAENFSHPRFKQAQEIDLTTDDDKQDRRIDDQEENRKKDEEMKMLVSKLRDLNGRPLEIPEYRDAYKDFPRERPNIVKPEDEIGRADGSKISSPSRSKFSMKIDQDPEYKSKYLDYPRDRPIYRKPPPILRPTMVPSGHSSACFGTPIHQGRTFEYKPISEVRSQYVPYGHISKVESLKMPSNLRLEGNIDLQPEYRDAYCTRDNYQIYDERKMYDKDCRNLSASKRGENFWLNNNKSEQCDDIVAKEPDAFQILDTRIHEESVIGKPPPSNRRDYKASRTMICPRSTQQVDRAIIRTRSPSPTYRLHVCDVDNEPRGFGRLKSSLSCQSSGRIRSPSPDHIIQDDVAKPYSPSFGRNIKQEHCVSNEPFVVLNAKSASSKRAVRRKQINKNTDFMSMSRGKPNTPPKWMPPWYDNTNTI